MPDFRIPPLPDSSFPKPSPEVRALEAQYLAMEDEARRASGIRGRIRELGARVRGKGQDDPIQGRSPMDYHVDWDKDESPKTDGYRDLWRDEPVAQYPVEGNPEKPDILERIRRRPKVAGTVVALSLLTPVAGFAASKLIDNDTPAAAHASKPKAVNSSTQTTVKTLETTTTTEVEVPQDPLASAIPNPRDLPKVLTEPISSSGNVRPGVALGSMMDLSPQTPEEWKKSTDAHFVGAYHSTLGIDFNIYATVPEGQQFPEGKKGVIHPETMEFVLQQMEENLQNAPDSSAKDELIRNYAAIKAGTEKRLIDLIVSVGDGPDCLDGAGQVVAYAQQVCEAIGVTSVAGDRSGNIASELPVVISRGLSPNTEQENFVQDGITWTRSVSANEADVAGQVIVFGHEVGGHAVGDGSLTLPKGDHNSYAVGRDFPHALIAGWLLYQHDGLDQSGRPFYDATTTNASPRLGDHFRALVDRGDLKPILEMVDGSK